MFKLGARSITNLANVHEDLRLIVEEAIKVSQVDFTITEGYRTIERQKELFDAGKSKIDGVTRKGKHNHFPSMAVDFIAYVPGKKKLAYDQTHLIYLVGVFTTVGELLYQQGKISHKVRSGANWDRDGELLYDQKFWDMPHIELI
jgi:peptidoglycan L-alanyl-D-glutamate endopeptidase CwlK